MSNKSISGIDGGLIMGRGSDKRIAKCVSYQTLIEGSFLVRTKAYIIIMSSVSREFSVNMEVRAPV